MVNTHNKSIMKSTIIKFAFLAVLILSAGCTKDLFNPDDADDIPDGNKDTDNPETTVDFATRHEATLNIDYGVNFPVPFEVYLENPIYLSENKDYVKDSTLFCVTKGWTGADGKISLPWKNKPDIVDEIYVYSSSLSVPRVIRASAETETINATSHSENIVVKSKATLTRAGSPNGSYYSKWETQNVTLSSFDTWTNEGRPNTMLPNSITLSDKAKRVIDATLPAEGSDELQITYKGGTLHLSEDAHVNLYFHSHQHGRNNTLAYYVYEGGEDDILSQEEINKNLIIAYPNTNNAVNSLQGIQLKYYKDGVFSDRFPAGTNIGWVLLVDAFNNGEIESANINVAYSEKVYNAYDMPGRTMHERPHSVVFKADNRYVLAFEDQPWGRSGKNANSTIYPIDLRDDIFIIDADPIRALPDVPSGNDPVEPDLSKDIPISSYGTVAFEDLWPNEGDYDMNDIVVSYEATDYFSTNTFSYTGFEGIFTFKHCGAQRNNAFGFQLETNRDNISYINITSDYTCAGQGLDTDLDKATIILFDNGKTVPVGTAFHVKVAYDKHVSGYLSYKCAPYNPFIAISAGPTQGNRAECHLTNYAPTKKVDGNMFGTFCDNSDIEKGKYYISKNGTFPFAIDVADLNFIGAKESVRLDVMYPGYTDWVNNGCSKQNVDWFLNPTE